MQPDADLETRLRRELAAEMETLPYHVDARMVHERLAQRPEGGWWRVSERLLGGIGGAVALLAVVMVAAIVLRTLPRAGTGAGPIQAPPSHVLVVAEVAGSATASSSPKLEARLADPATLAAVDGVPTIGMGHFFQTALSHDARTLAIIRWPGDSPYGAELVLADVDSGKVTDTGVKLDGDVPFMAFTADDRSLLFIQGQRDNTSAAYRIARFEVGGSGSVEYLDRLPNNTWPVDARLLPNGQLAVMAAHARPSPPALSPSLVFYGTDGRQQASVSLPGVLVGEQQLSDGTIAVNTPGLAWDLTGSRLYIAHPDADVVTVADLAARNLVATVNAAPQTSWLDELSVGTAAAKLEPGNDRAAALSPDGSRLYVVGSVRTRTGTGDSALFSQTPVGGFVLDTRALKRVASISLPVDRVLASPTGTSIVFSGTTLDRGTEAAAEASMRAEMMLTDADLHVIARTRLAAGGWIMGLTFDGSSVYVAQGSVVEARSMRDLTWVGGAPGTSVEPYLP